MKIGDIVSCEEHGLAIILGPCDVPIGVPEESLPIFLNDPDAWPTEKGWSIQLLESENKILSVHSHNLNIVNDSVGAA